MSRRTNRKKVNEEQIEAVLDIFYNTMDNSTASIAEKTNLHVRQVDRIIDKDLKKREK